MARCEDFPCCGHEAGCCPDFENGRQMNMVCTCGAKLPINNRYSICDTCLRIGEESDLLDDEIHGDRLNDINDDEDRSCDGCGEDGTTLHKWRNEMFCSRCYRDLVDYHTDMRDYDDR